MTKVEMSSALVLRNTVELSVSAPKSQHFKSQRPQDANASKSQMLSRDESQRFSATKALMTGK